MIRFIYYFDKIIKNSFTIFIFYTIIASAIKMMSVNELRDFIFKNYYKRIGFVKERSSYSMKRLK